VVREEVIFNLKIFAKLLDNTFLISYIRYIFDTMKLSKAFGLIFIFICFHTEKAINQDYIYKKDHTAIQASVISVNENLISYKLFNDSSRVIHYLSISIVDSLKYSQGETRRFNSGLTFPVKKVEKATRDYFQVDLFNLANNNLNLQYEHLLKTTLFSYVIGLMVNPNESVDHYYNSGTIYYKYDPFKYFFRIGMNFYPVKGKNIEYSTGISNFFGQYRKLEWDYNYYPYSSETKSVFAFTTMSVNSVRFQVVRHVFLLAGLEVSIYPLLELICPNAGLAVSF
jgi:hypothetical protein